MKLLIYIIFLIFSLFVYFYGFVGSRMITGELEMVFFDVGQGDSTLIKSPDGREILIDTGKSDQILSLLRDSLGYFGAKIDLVIITHPDADHYEMLPYILKNFDVGKVVLNKTPKSDALYDFVKSEVVDADVEVISLDSNSDFRLGCCVNIDVLWPSDDFGKYRVEEINDHSIALKISYGQFDAFLAGDLGSYYELESLQGLKSKEFELLKVGHHGSETSTSLEFVETLKPRLAIISAGENNSYGHPHQVVLKNLEGIEIYRTDQLGHILVKTDGANIDVDSRKRLVKKPFYL